MVTRVPARARREDGATAVEYGLLLVLIVIVVAGALPLVGHNLQAMYRAAALAVGDH